ncbi:hypothetical protein BU23DRAFT_565877 [Bimuria novae-zelandiae CBS 107.79]|uniref:Uncharacterized protein n=1 Tax=Bimuria novae-zelandiae CBS 107.79 TaxID=1447943 RepID=A0A6A5VGK1_9PLEO|nr:hypothetical protein BU23DRAFT_565877 [Bimuria novae-zelandiae CBS 107.79]
MGALSPHGTRVSARAGTCSSNLMVSRRTTKRLQQASEALAVRRKEVCSALELLLRASQTCRSLADVRGAFCPRRGSWRHVSERDGLGALPNTEPHVCSCPEGVGVRRDRRVRLREDRPARIDPCSGGVREMRVPNHFHPLAEHGLLAGWNVSASSSNTT